MSKSVSQAMVRVALARLHVAAAMLTSSGFNKGVPDKNSLEDRALAQVLVAIEELETHLPFTTKRN
jgi:hypothetical protein